LTIERKLKFFICSVAFNGTDGYKLPNLNDVNEDSVLRDEEPCSDIDEKYRYSCEPTPLLVSACLMKSLKRQSEIAPRSLSRVPRSNRGRIAGYRRNNHGVVAAAGKHAWETAHQARCRGGGESNYNNKDRLLEATILKPDHNRILNEINKLFQNNPSSKNVSVLKQLLLRSASEQHKAFVQQQQQQRQHLLHAQHTEEVDNEEDETENTKDVEVTIINGEKN